MLTTVKRTFQQHSTPYQLFQRVASCECNRRMSKLIDYPPNSSIEPKFVQNRNPRSLERLRIGDKPVGFNLDKPGKNFWNRILIDFSTKRIYGRIQHVSGKVPVSASSNEWCIKKFLFSATDVTASETVGRVLAHRCLQTGINEVSCHYTPEERSKERLRVFLDAIEKGGVNLNEPPRFTMPIELNEPGIQEKAWEVFEEASKDLRPDQLPPLKPWVEPFNRPGRPPSEYED